MEEELKESNNEKEYEINNNEQIEIPSPNKVDKAVKLKNKFVSFKSPKNKKESDLNIKKKTASGENFLINSNRVSGKTLTFRDDVSINRKSVKSINNYLDKQDDMPKDKNEVKVYRNQPHTFSSNMTSNVVVVSSSNRLNQSLDIICNNLTCHEIDKLPLVEYILVDKKSFCLYFWNQIKSIHELMSIFFVYSMIDPFFVRFLKLAFNISLNLAIGAVFFSDEYINQQALNKVKYGSDSITFWYITF